MNKNRAIIIIFFVLSFVFNYTSVARAETHIPDDTYIQDEVWTKEKSPYILEGGVFVSSGGSLTIEAGTKIQALPGLENIPSINVERAKLRIYGTPEDKVTFENIYGLFVNSSSTAIINNINADFKYGVSINFSSATISDSTLSHSERAVEVKGSDVLIKNSTISDNQNGIYALSTARPYLMYDHIEKDVGGEGNAFSDFLPFGGAGIKIENSSLLNNSEYAITNRRESIIDARNNWWGNVSGPNTDEQNKLFGDVLFEPWLNKDPNEKNICCSSVLFIPGLEASQLFRNELSSAFGTTTNTLWEPNNNNDVYKLYLDENGSSTDKTVYSGKPISSAYGYFGVYDKFMKYLDTLVTDNTIREWKDFGYDWRKSITDLVSGTEIKSTTTESLINSLLELANRSNTKKVTIIAHSNGGLVTKLLLNKLSQMGKSDIVDKVISVAVPYLGTPQAIAGLLYGDKQSIAYGLILSKSVARGLGLNMSSAYSLLPSNKYFERILTPTIVFASSTIDNLNSGSYPREIKNSDMQNDFIVDKYDDRKDVRFGDVTKPAKGNKYLINLADTLHRYIDYMNWPENVGKLAIAGYNKLTTSGLHYDDNGKLMISKTTNGDGTVVYPSATYDDGDVVNLDLQTISKTNNKNINHANILESVESLKIIDNAIKSRNISSSNLATMNGVSTTTPNFVSEPVNLVISTHSPVDLHIYDEKGNHTGAISIPKNLNIDSDSASMFETNIPDSEYFGGDEDEDKYIYIPESINKKYRIEVLGRGFGEFSLNIDRMIGDKVLNSVSYENIPVTPLTSASTTVVTLSAGSDQSLEKDKYSSSTLPLSVDLDASGTVDLKISQNQKLSNDKVLEYIQKFMDKHIKDKNRIKRISKIIEKMKHKYEEREKNNKDTKSKKITDNKIQNIIDKMKHYDKNNRNMLDEREVEEYINKISQKDEEK